MKNSPIVEALTECPSEEAVLSDHDRVALAELLAFVGGLLRGGVIWINDQKADQTPYISLCARMAKLFANIKPQEQQ